MAGPLFPSSRGLPGRSPFCMGTGCHSFEVQPRGPQAGWGWWLQGLSSGRRWPTPFLDWAERRGGREPGDTDWVSLGLPCLPAQPPHPHALVPVLELPSSLPPSCSLSAPRGTRFHLNCSNICAGNHFSPSAFLWQLVAVHSVARTYLKMRNFKLSLGEFK